MHYGKKVSQCPDVLLWSVFCWETLGPAIHVDVTLTRSTYLSIAADHVHPFMETLFPDGCGLFQQDNAPCHKAEMVQEWFDDHNNQFEVLTPPNSPDLNPIQNLWDVLDKQVPSMEAPPHNLLDLKDLLLTSWCQIPQHTFKEQSDNISYVRIMQPCESPNYLLRLICENFILVTRSVSDLFVLIRVKFFCEGVVSVSVSLSEGGVVSVSVSLSEGGVVSVSVSLSEGGVVSVSVSLSEGGVVSCPSVSVKEAWSRCPSVSVKEAWSRCPSVSVKEAWSYLSERVVSVFPSVSVKEAWSVSLSE
ncbi:hypothetical protein QTP70_007940 [Hemibagrus guttatus]|uniref:Tc1-like transposase DDE domain-containing protein n=1 Tax=Hemibagrus guttatus TaxID=175788 RepID=A0AAE0QWZ7_9TELE|nr:hypothetical protein QTP70_007940 [Hemibagrus guttatus]